MGEGGGRIWGDWTREPRGAESPKCSLLQHLWTLLRAMVWRCPGDPMMPVWVAATHMHWLLRVKWKQLVGG